MSEPRQQLHINDRLGKVLAAYTNSQVAQALGVDTSTVSRLRSGERRPTLEQLRGICTWLKLSADYLLGLSSAAEARRVPDDGPMIMVARLARLDHTGMPALPDGPVDGRVPYLVRDLNRLIGARLEDPDRLVLIPALSHSGHLLVDRGFQESDIRSHEVFVVWHQGRFSVCTIKVLEPLIICDARDGRELIIDPGKDDSAGPHLVARVLEERRKLSPSG
jgi:transcriptional regulator with XRE-family HTH domain